MVLSGDQFSGINDDASHGWINNVVSGSDEDPNVSEGIVEVDKEGGAECHGPGIELQPNECRSGAFTAY